MKYKTYVLPQLIGICLVLISGAVLAQKPVKIRFDSNKEVSGQKFAIRDISPGLPMIIGEYHFGTVDRGMAQSLWQVNNQQERGVAYRYYTERAYSHPGLIGTAWFQWCDQDLTGRRDGENYNCGFIDVTDRPYKYLVEAVSETSGRLFDIHSGKIQPIDQAPVKARGHGGFPDIW